MPINYPISIDDLPNPLAGDSMAGHASLHDKVSDSILAIETKLGANSSTDPTSIEYKVNALIAASTVKYTDLAIIASPQNANAWTNQPVAETEIFGLTYNRVVFNLSNFSYFRIVSNKSVVGTAGAKIRVQYSTDGTNFFQLENVTTTADLDIEATGVAITAWAPIVAAAKADVTIRIIGWDGNATNDPAWRQLHIQFY